MKKEYPLYTICNVYKHFIILKYILYKTAYLFFDCLKLY